MTETIDVQAKIPTYDDLWDAWLKAIAERDAARQEVISLKEKINRWQGMIMRQVLDVAAKCTKEMQQTIRKEDDKTDVLT